MKRLENEKKRAPPRIELGSRASKARVLAIIPWRQARKKKYLVFVFKKMDKVMKAVYFACSKGTLNKYEILEKWKIALEHASKETKWPLHAIAGLATDKEGLETVQNDITTNWTSLRGLGTDWPEVTWSTRAAIVLASIGLYMNEAFKIPFEDTTNPYRNSVATIDDACLAMFRLL